MGAGGEGGGGGEEGNLGLADEDRYTENGPRARPCCLPQGATFNSL